MTELAEWVGRSDTAAGEISAASVAGLAATLDRDDPAPRAGDPLPPGWHWMFFQPVARQSALGPDGHPARGGFLPPVPLPRRMWAGSATLYHRPLRVGEHAARRSEVIAVSSKQGRSGPLVFVTVRHVISGDEGPALTEEQNIVYREAESGGHRPPEPAPAAALWSRTVRPDPVMLFRYSALTFNGHRIHYDRAYVTEVEGYPDLIVHGPLTATLLLDLIRREMPQRRLARFAFQARRPLFVDRELTVAAAPGTGGVTAWALDDTGALAMTAEAEFTSD